MRGDLDEAVLGNWDAHCRHVYDKGFCTDEQALYLKHAGVVETGEVDLPFSFLDQGLHATAGFAVPDNPGQDPRLFRERRTGGVEKGDSAGKLFKFGRWIDLQLGLGISEDFATGFGDGSGDWSGSIRDGHLPEQRIGLRYGDDSGFGFSIR